MVRENNRKLLFLFYPFESYSVQFYSASVIITVVLIVYGEARHAKKKKKKTTVQSKYSKLRTIYIESKEAGEISYIYYFSIVLQ